MDLPHKDILVIPKLDLMYFITACKSYYSYNPNVIYSPLDIPAPPKSNANSTTLCGSTCSTRCHASKRDPLLP